MTRRKLSEQRIKECVFVQPYEKKSDNAIRQKPWIDGSFCGDDVPERFQEPLVTPDNVALKELPNHTRIEVRVYDRKAINPYDTGGRYEPGDCLDDIDDAQERCDAAIQKHGLVVNDDLSAY